MLWKILDTIGIALIVVVLVVIVMLLGGLFGMALNIAFEQLFGIIA